MNITIPLITWIGRIFGVAAILCACTIIGGSFLGLAQGNPKPEEWENQVGWTALVFLAIYLACEVARIGH